MSSAPARPLLEAEGLGIRLPSDGRTVLSGVSLSLAAGEIVDLVGPSGAGKSMLLRALARTLPAAVDGLLVLDGVASPEIAPERWRAQVALLPQRPALVEGTLRDNLALPWRLAVRKDETFPSDAVLRRGLDELRLDEVALDEDASRLSVGQQSRVALLRVLITAPRVMLLDEPDAALDAESASAVSAALDRFASGGGAVLRARHRVDDGLALRRYVISKGTLQEEVLR